MSELTKQALKVENNQSFPNNNAGLITPTALRTFNEDMIDSTVNQAVYTADSASFNSRINAITGSGGTVNTGSLLTTASFNDSTRNLTFTKGDSSQFSVNIPDNSGSVLPSGVVSGSSQITQLGFQTTASFNAYTSSNDSKVNSLINATSSYAISSSVAAVDAGQQLQINSLIAATSSYVTSAITASSLITASFDNGTRNLTFTKGNNTQFSVNIPDVSGSTGNFVTTASFNAFTESQETKNTTLQSVTASLNSATASLFTSTSLSLYTASISGQLLTFTKGNNTQFTLTVPTGSGVYVTGSYGAFQDSTTQSGSANTAYRFKFNTTDVSDGVILSGSTGLQVGAYGVYNLQWSGQAAQGSGTAIVSIWVNVNGIEVPGTRGDVTLASNTKLLPAWTYLLTLNQNDVVELEWASDSNNTTWQYLPEGTTPTTPSAASIIVSLNRVDVGGGSNSVSNTIFNAYTASINTYTQSNDTKWTTLGGLTGSYATTGSNSFNGNQTVNGNVKQTINAPTDGNQVDFISVNGAVIDGTPYNYVNFGLLDYQSFGDQYKDGFVMEYYDSLSFNHGAEFSVNPKRIGASMNLSGSAVGISQLRDLGGNKTFLNQYANVINIGAFAAGTTDLIYIGHNTLPVLRLSSLKNEITGSTTISGSVNILSTLTASLQEGFVLAGGAGNVSTLVATSSFGGGSTDISSLNAFTASAEIRLTNLELETASLESSVTNLNAFTSSQQGLNGTFATTGSNNFIGNQTITGSLTISGSEQNDVRVVGKILVTGSTPLIENTDGVSIEYMAASFGGNIGVASAANATEIGIALSGGAWTTNWANGPIIYVNNTPGDTYEGVFGFQNKSNYTDGRITALKRLDVSGSVNIQNTLTASLQQGYVWVGDANGRTTTVSTGSFGGGGGSAFPFTGSAQITGSLGLTGSISEFVNTLTIASSTASVNFNDGNMFTLTLVTGSVTHITPTNIRRGQTINIQINQPAGASSGSVSFSPNVLFPGGADYQATATGSAIDLLTFVSLDGTNVLAASIKNFQ